MIFSIALVLVKNCPDHKSLVKTLEAFLVSALHLHKKKMRGSLRSRMMTEQNIAKPRRAFMLFQMVLLYSSDIQVRGTKMKKNRSRITRITTIMNT
jgi:hypothetical protein